MPKQYHQIRNFEGLANRKNPRDIGNGLSKAQNISVDVGGLIKTIGGLETHSEVPTHAAVLCPGSGLYPYGSDHWRGTDTIVDLLAADNAASDEGGEVDAVGGWVESDTTLTSVAQGDGGIANSGIGGSSYIIKVVLTDTSGLAFQNISTVVGQSYTFHAHIYCKDATSIRIYALNTPLTNYTESYSTASWLSVGVVFEADQTSTSFRVEVVGSIGEIAYFDNVYVTKTSQPDFDTTWLALADVASAQVDSYNSRDASFTANLLDFGTVSKYVEGGGQFTYAPNTITDSAAKFLNSNIQEGKVYKSSGNGDQSANDVLFVVERVNAETIYARGNPFTVQASETGPVTLTEYNPTDFHFVDDSLSVSPVGGGIALRPKQYRFVDRIHLSGAGSSEDNYQAWYLNDIGLPPPTDISAVANNGDQAMGDIGSAGTGLEIGITATADDGEWLEGTYIIALSFMYNDGEESELYIPSTEEEFDTTIVDGDSLTLTVRAKGPYNERVSGARFYARLDETDEPWTLLSDISMTDGARATLSGQYNAWTASSTANVAYTNNFKSKRINIDTYESLTGFNPDVRIAKFTSDNTFYDASVIAGNRTFIFGPRYTDAGGKTVHFRDRILFSKINEYDVFPIENLIDVTGSDAEDFVAGAVYGNDLLCFKQNTLYIVDISDPLLFRMKKDQQQGKYPFRGISIPGAMFDTPHGLAWINQWGMWLYNGAEILDLLGDKIERSKYPLKHERYIHCDGDDDYLSIANDANLNFGANSDFSFVMVARRNGNPTVNERIIDKGGATELYQVVFHPAGAIKLFIDGTDGSAGVVSDSVDNSDGIFRHIVVTCDRDSVTGLRLYINGLLDGTPADPTGVGDIDDVTKSFAIGIESRNLASSPLLGDVREVLIYNRALAPKEIEQMALGYPVPKPLIIGDNSSMNSVGGWQPRSAATITGGYDSGDSGHEDTLRLEAGSPSGDGGSLAITALDITHRWKLEFDYKTISSFSGESDIVLEVGGDTLLLTRLQESATWAPYTETFKPSFAFDELRILCQKLAGGAADDEMLIDNVYLTDLDTLVTFPLVVDQWGEVGVTEGAVLSLPQDNIPSTHDSGVWPDDSDNDLDAVFNGATPILPDTWEDFWTDYSILGYYGRTNQLIVMRDCTGHWSLGNDYGDCWITDLDTLYSTTGRRIFKAKTAYTNWATDWNGDLIIGRQSGSNIITEKWTDKPQAQAVGLIHIETADIDFGNPAIIKIIDAFTATIKTDTGQTNPISYALDGTDTWTTISGNFTAAQLWSKYLAEPTVFNCNTLRLRIINSNAGTIEINELIIRHDPQLLKLS